MSAVNNVDAEMIYEIYFQKEFFQPFAITSSTNLISTL